jgi:hypothetical protein
MRNGKKKTREVKAQVNLDEAQQKGGDLTLSVDVLRILAVGQQEVQHLEVHARQLWSAHKTASAQAR